MDTLQDRLAAFIAYKRLTFKDFEQLAGFGASTAKRIGPHSYKKTFTRISDAFPDLNIDWLITGEGEMLVRPVRQTATGNNNMLAGRDVNAAPPSTMEEALAALRRSQEQISTLLTIIDRLTRGND